MSDPQRKYEEVRHRFLSRTKSGRARIEELADAIDAIGCEKAAAEIEQLAHRLAGSAGTFGLAEIGRRASEAELEANALRRGKATHRSLAGTARAMSAAIEASE